MINNLAQLIEQIETYASTSQPPLRSVLVLHHRSVIVERYWHSFTPTSYQPIYSITKSVISALVGLALADGQLTLSDTLAHWFPDKRFGLPAKSVTIQHLLTMTAGFDKSKRKYTAASDLTDILLARQMAAQPGERFRYTDDDLDLLVAILERAVGQPALDYAQQRLFAPLGIWPDVPRSHRKRLWVVNKQGRVRGGYGLHLTTRELAAFGQLYLQRGQWQGKQLLPADFIAASTLAQTAGGYPEFVKYGYCFWISTANAQHPAFFASGRGGQFIYIVPTLDLVVVITTLSKGDGRSHRVMVTRWVTQFLESTKGALNETAFDRT